MRRRLPLARVQAQASGDRPLGVPDGAAPSHSCQQAVSCRHGVGEAHVVAAPAERVAEPRLHPQHRQQRSRITHASGDSADRCQPAARARALRSRTRRRRARRSRRAPARRRPPAHRRRKQRAKPPDSTSGRKNSGKVARRSFAQRSCRGQICRAVRAPSGWPKARSTRRTRLPARARPWSPPRPRRSRRPAPGCRRRAPDRRGATAWSCPARSRGRRCRRHTASAPGRC